MAFYAWTLPRPLDTPKILVWPLVHVPEFPIFCNPNPENEDVLIILLGSILTCQMDPYVHLQQPFCNTTTNNGSDVVKY